MWVNLGVVLVSLSLSFFFYKIGLMVAAILSRTLSGTALRTSRSVPGRRRGSGTGGAAGFNVSMGVEGQQSQGHSHVVQTYRWPTGHLANQLAHKPHPHPDAASAFPQSNWPQASGVSAHRWSQAPGCSEFIVGGGRLHQLFSILSLTGKTS